MGWGHAHVLRDFGALVTARAGAAPTFGFRVPLGILPASEIRRVVLSFVPIEPRAPEASGALRMWLELGTGQEFEPLARTVAGETAVLELSSAQDVLANELFELDSLSPALEEFVPVWLRVEGNTTAGATAPPVWEILDAMLVTIQLAGQPEPAEPQVMAEPEPADNERTTPR